MSAPTDYHPPTIPDDLPQPSQPLQEALDAPPAGTPDTPDDRFRIEALGQAEWAMRKLHRALSRIEELQAHYEARHQAIEQWLIDQGVAAERARLDAWRAEAIDPYQQELEFFAGLLTDWHRRTIDQEIADGVDSDHLTKSVKLPGGKATSRAVPGRLEVTDDPDTVADVLEAAGLGEAVKRAPSLSAIGDLIKSGSIEEGDLGLVIPGANDEVVHLGVQRVGKGRSFSVEVELDSGNTAKLSPPDRVD